ncbi:roadblock/LC7 domain-containing protein [Streptomyces pseudovenezuelae]|uniref:roadblock/LC7 domain-containing protein n=1 Tax=Streptomyces pseudovenezuelae TaxID=67350 RepID=UPI0036E5E980
MTSYDTALTPNGGSAVDSTAQASDPLSDMAWLLNRFVEETPDVTHSVLLSRDGITLLDSEVDKDWVEPLSAAMSGVASLAANVTGPSRNKMEPLQVVIERPDCFFFLHSAGRSRNFENVPGILPGQFVDTVLCVIATPGADVGSVGYETGQLIGRFAEHMNVSVRRAGDDA